MCIPTLGYSFDCLHGRGHHRMMIMRLRERMDETDRKNNLMTQPSGLVTRLGKQMKMS